MDNTPRLVPLGSNAQSWAQRFAAEQFIPEKAKKVYLNTLAVYAVYTYLKWLQIEGDLSLGESWNLGTRTLFDVADLVLPGVGKLECRPVLPNETKVSLPPEVSEDRIGYVAVLLSEPFYEAQLVGFLNASEVSESEVMEEEIQLEAFQPITNLLRAIPEEVVEEEKPKFL